MHFSERRKLAERNVTPFSELSLPLFIHAFSIIIFASFLGYGSIGKYKIYIYLYYGVMVGSGNNLKYCTVNSRQEGGKEDGALLYSRDFFRREFYIFAEGLPIVGDVWAYIFV